MSRREEALALHRACPVVVGHADLPAELQLRRQAGESGALLARYLPRCRAAGIRVLIGAVYVHPSYLPEMALRTALAQIGALLTEIKESRHAFQLVKDAAELDAALADGRIAVLLAMEGTEPLCGSAELLLPFYTLGVRLLGLTWNGRTQAADGCGLPGAGLTPFGRELAQAAWSLGMILDVSHLNDAGFDDLLALGGGPVLATHSNCRALCRHARNLDNAQLQSLGRRGGVIGINQVRFLARSPGSAGTLEDLCRQIFHIEQQAGPGSAGLGLDLARDYMEALPRPRAFWQSWNPEEEDILRNYGQLPELTALLLEHGMDRGAVSGVLGGNFLRFLRRHLPQEPHGASEPTAVF